MERCVLLKGFSPDLSKEEIMNTLSLTDGSYSFCNKFQDIECYVERKDDVRWIVLFHSEKDAAECRNEHQFEFSTRQGMCTVIADYCSECIIPEKYLEVQNMDEMELPAVDSEDEKIFECQELVESSPSPRGDCANSRSEMEGQQENTAQKTNIIESDASLAEALECVSLLSNAPMDTNSQQCIYNPVCSIQLCQDDIDNNPDTEHYRKDSPENVDILPVNFNVSISSVNMFGYGPPYETDYSKIEGGRTEFESCLQSASKSDINEQSVNSQNCIPAPMVPLFNQYCGTDMHPINVCASSQDPLLASVPENVTVSQQNFMPLPHHGMFPYHVQSPQYHMMAPYDNFPPAPYKLVSAPFSVPQGYYSTPRFSYNVPFTSPPFHMPTHYMPYWFPFPQIPFIPNANMPPSNFYALPYGHGPLPSNNGNHNPYDYDYVPGQSTNVGHMRTNSATESQCSKEDGNNTKAEEYITPVVQSQNSEEDVKKDLEVKIDVTVRDEFKSSVTSQSEPIYDEILPETLNENLQNFQHCDEEESSKDIGMNKEFAKLTDSSTRPSFKVTNKITTRIVLGSLATQNVDVIVNSTNQSIDLNVGTVSKKLLEVGGEVLQNECRSKYPDGITVGQIAVTSGHNLPCRNVFHGVIPIWDHGRGNSEKIMAQFIDGCLDTADTCKFSSIAFPALGTGALWFPADVVANLFFSVIRTYERNNPGTNLQLVHLVLWERDKAVIKAFRNAESRPASVIRYAHQPFTQGNEDSHMVGHVTLMVCQNDITKETTEVIVNSTTKDFNLATGFVSNAILKAAGTNIQVECNERYKKGKKMLVTNAGKLQCQKIIHLSARSSMSNWQKSIVMCLNEVEDMGFSSISFPALGTGGKGITPQSIAKTFVSAIFEYTTSKQCQNSKKTVRIVILDNTMFETFKKSIKDALNKKMVSDKRFVPKLFRRQCAKENDTIAMCADSTKCVSGIVKKLETEEVLFTKNFQDKIDQQMKEFQQAGKSKGVNVQKKSNQIVISGYVKSDVCEVKKLIEQYLEKISGDGP